MSFSHPSGRLHRPGHRVWPLPPLRKGPHAHAQAGVQSSHVGSAGPNQVVGVPHCFGSSRVSLLVATSGCLHPGVDKVLSALRVPLPRARLALSIDLAPIRFTTRRRLRRSVEKALRCAREAPAPCRRGNAPTELPRLTAHPPDPGGIGPHEKQSRVSWPRRGCPRRWTGRGCCGPGRTEWGCRAAA